MEVDFTGRQMEITPDLQQYTRQHLRKLERLFPESPKLHVILTREKHRRIAEMTIKLRDQTLIGIMETADTRSAIKGALDKLERQAVRWFQRRRTKKRRPKPTSAILVNVIGSSRVDHEEARVVESERVPVKPLTLDEAIEALDASASGVVVFRNAETERVNVVYRRPDGNLGLIEPEP
ncbi:MAG: ribosome-associated translation inhibitor RaiA [Acidobacteria bacterium]|nr:ribosome-associated translation inhibitor RaiA [Acidobacteriota bacterium]